MKSKICSFLSATLKRPLYLACALVAAFLATAGMGKAILGMTRQRAAPTGQPTALAQTKRGLVPRPDTVGAGASVQPSLPTPGAGAVALPPAAPPALAGNIAYLDPKTGWFGQPPREVMDELGKFDAFSTSSAGLEETASPVQRGGLLVNLRGRFQHAMTIAVDANGQLSSTCESALAAPAAHAVVPDRTEGKP